MYNHVIWPHPYDPRHSAIYALNDIDVKARPEVVWKLLVDAKNWSSHFPPEDQVEILSGEAELKPGTKFHRVTVGYPMSPIVTEFVRGRRLAWLTTVDGDETGSTAITAGSSLLRIKGVMCCPRRRSKASSFSN
jgi:hypothetical protein